LRIELSFMMTETGKLLIFIGGAIALLGVVIFGFGRLGFRGLPGDISYRSDNVRVYFPVVTCIVISILLTLASWLYHWIGRK
jgi:hypothetical protein